MKQEAEERLLEPKRKETVKEKKASMDWSS